MIDRKGFMPGYTGHIPKFSENESFEQPPPKYFHIPNYQGFIPSVKSENLYGKTYSKITEISSLKQFTEGKDLPPSERFKSISQENYKNQLRVPVMPLKPKKYPTPPRSKLDQIPQSTISSFFGVKVPKSQIFLNEEIKNEPKKAEKNEKFLCYEEARKLANEELVRL